MKTKRFPSKVDRWLLAVLVLAVVIQIVALAGVLDESEDLSGPLIGSGVLLLTVGLFTWLLRSTYYEVSGDTLRVVSGPFRRRIKIEAIDSIEPTRSPLSSPALSLDRLRISYGKRRVLVSPADKRGFLKALGFDENRSHA